MKPRLVIIDEPIHVIDQTACDLWRKALWAKEQGYRSHYKSAILPVGADDFFATHFIVADERPNGRLEPMMMYKSVRRSQATRFRVPFGAESLVKGTIHENSPELKAVLNDPSEISYDSSWSINPMYKDSKEISALLRDYATVFSTVAHNSLGFYRWLTAGVTRFKIDQYFEWLGGKEIIPEFKLAIIDNDSVRMFYIADTLKVPQGPLDVVEKYKHDWNNRILFYPPNSALEKVA